MIPGLGASIRPPLLDECYVDDLMRVEEADAIRACHRLARHGFQHAMYGQDLADPGDRHLTSAVRCGPASTSPCDAGTDVTRKSAELTADPNELTAASRTAPGCREPRRC